MLENIDWFFYIETPNTKHKRIWNDIAIRLHIDSDRQVIRDNSAVLAYGERKNVKIY